MPFDPPRNDLDVHPDDLARQTQAEALTVLYPAVAHHLRGCLNNLVIHLELLRTRQGNGEATGEGSASQRRRVQVLHDEVARLSRTLLALLAYGRPLALRGGPLDLVAAVEELAALLEPQAERMRIRLHHAPAERPLRVPGPGEPVRLALLAMAAAALAGAGESGTVELAVERRGDRAVARVGGEPAAGPTPGPAAPDGPDGGATGGWSDGWSAARTAAAAASGSLRVERRGAAAVYAELELATTHEEC
jgi:signal transduction histidine kinase